MTIACAPGRLRCEHLVAVPSNPRRRHRTLLHAACSALSEAFLAFRRYERLRSIRVPHDIAIRDALTVRLNAIAAPNGHRHVDAPAR